MAVVYDTPAKTGVVYDTTPAASGDEDVAGEHTPTPDSGQALAEQEGVTTLPEAKAATRGLIKGGTSLVTAPADLGMWVGHNLRKYATGGEDEDYKNLSDYRDAMLDRIIPRPTEKGMGAVETAGDIAGSALTLGAPGAGATRAPKIADESKIWESAGKTAENQRILAGLVGRQFGEEGIEKLGPEELSLIHDKITGVLDAVRSPLLSYNIDQRAARTMIGNIDGKYGLSAQGGQALINRPEIQRFVKLVNTGNATPQQLSEVAQAIRAEAESTIKSPGGYSYGKALRDVHDMIEDTIQGGLSPTMQQMYAKARGDYRTWRQLMDSGAVKGDGKTDFAQLGRFLAGSDEAGYLRGGNQSPMYQAARWGQRMDPMGQVDEMGRLVYGKTRAMWRAITEVLPAVGQKLANSPDAIAATARGLANHPGFAGAFQRALRQEGLGEEPNE